MKTKIIILDDTCDEVGTVEVLTDGLTRKFAGVRFYPRNESSLSISMMRYIIDVMEGVHRQNSNTEPN